MPPKGSLCSVVSLVFLSDEFIERRERGDKRETGEREQRPARLLRRTLTLQPHAPLLFLALAFVPAVAVAFGTSRCGRGLTELPAVAVAFGTSHPLFFAQQVSQPTFRP